MSIHQSMTVAAMLIVSLLAASIAAAQDGEALYYPCTSCHGPDGAGNEATGAPAIAGMNPEYLAKQMRYFRDGLRGKSLKDLGGRQMSLIAALLTDDGEIDALASYVADLPRTNPPATLPARIGGDNGVELYRPCAACHGETGEGRPSLNAPRLSGLNDWYILSRLEGYRDGVYGVNPNHLDGQLMAAAAAQLTDDQIEALARFGAALPGH